MLVAPGAELLLWGAARVLGGTSALGVPLPPRALEAARSEGSFAFSGAAPPAPGRRIFPDAREVMINLGPALSPPGAPSAHTLLGRPLPIGPGTRGACSSPTPGVPEQPAPSLGALGVIRGLRVDESPSRPRCASRGSRAPGTPAGRVRARGTPCRACRVPGLDTGRWAQAQKCPRP